MATLRRRWVRGAVLLLGLCVLVWVALRSAPHVPIYLRNLRVRVRVPAAQVPEFDERVLIVAPHPDDETLGCAGLIQKVRDSGAEVFVVLMTNGDGWQYERGLLLAEDILRGTAQEHLALGRQRRRETLGAMAALGIPADHVISLGYPDGSIHAMWQPQHWSATQPYRSPHTGADHIPYANSLSPGAPHCGAQVLSDVRRVLEMKHPTAVFTTAPFDVQRDHWGTYGFVRLAVAEMNTREGTDIPVYGFLIHRHDWPAPQGYHPSEPLEPPAAWLRIPGVSWRRLDLSSRQVQAKHGCLSRYRTQNAGHSAELLAFVRRNELFSELAEVAQEDGRVQIVDPVGDLPPDRLRPEQDISSLELVKTHEGWRVELGLAARPSRELRYCVVWHGLRKSGTSVCSVLWEKGHARLLQASGDGPMQASQLGGEVSSQALAASVPPEAIDAPDGLLEAYSQQGRHYLDHTCTLVADLWSVGDRAAPPR